MCKLYGDGRPRHGKLTKYWLDYFCQTQSWKSRTSGFPYVAQQRLTITFKVYVNAVNPTVLASALARDDGCIKSNVLRKVELVQISIAVL